MLDRLNKYYFQAEYVSGLSIFVFLPGGQHGDAPVGKGKARAPVNPETYSPKRTRIKHPRVTRCVATRGRARSPDPRSAERGK